MRSAPRAIKIAIATLCLASAAVAASAHAAPGSDQGPARILGFDYYEDLEDGRHHNLGATVKGAVERMSAKSAGVRSAGRLSGHISPGGRARSWFFRDRDFVKAVRAQFEAAGVATVKVTASGGGRTIRKLCTLRLGPPDPLYGDSAQGDCTRLD